MKIEKASGDGATVVVPTDEILYLYHALRMTLEMLPPSHFRIRTQETAEYAEGVRDQLADLIARIKAL